MDFRDMYKEKEKRDLKNSWQKEDKSQRLWILIKKKNVYQTSRIIANMTS